MAAAMLVVVIAYRPPGHLVFGKWREGWRQFSIGFSGAASVGAETTAFATMAIFAGMIGAFELAAYAIAHNLVGMLFMVSLGISNAVGVRVSMAHAAQDWLGLQRVTWVGLTLLIGLQGIVSIGIAIAPEQVARIYGQDPLLTPFLTVAIMTVALIAVADGAQAVMGHALRARGDRLWSALSSLFSYGVFMIGSAYILAFVVGLDLVGLLLAVALASFVSWALLAYRFFHLRTRFNTIPSSG